MMRKVISLVLVLLVSLSMTLPVLAAGFTPSIPHTATTNPKTGDMIMIWVAVLALSAIALVTLVVMYRKKAR